MNLWIVIADGAGARVAEAHYRNAAPRLIHQIEHAKSRAKGMDIVTDRPGSVRGNFGAEAMGPTTEPKEVEAEEFARQLAAFLEKKFDSRLFEALAILAPAHFLGLLRANLSPELERVVVFSQAMELSYVRDSQLGPHLAQAIDASFHESFARRAAE